MAQTFVSDNLQKYQIGKQTDIAVADGGTATTASNFYSLNVFETQNAPEPQMIEDAEGNRTTNSHAVIGERSYPFSFGGTTDVDKIGLWLYYAMGAVSSAQDGATGAYEHTYSMLNNVVLPEFTIFYNLDGEDSSAASEFAGYRRLSNCHIASLTIDVSDTEATFSGEGFARNDDSQANVSSTVSSLTATDVEYQSSSGLIRYTFSGTPDLSSVKNGDVMVASGSFSNSTNVGSFIIVNVVDASDYVEVINPNRTDASDDETSVSISGNSVTVVTTPSYAEPSGILLRRHSCVLDATNEAGLATATAAGLRNFSIEINNNSAEIREGIKSPNPSNLFGKNIASTVSFTQLLGTTAGAKAIAYRANDGVRRAWRFEMEDTSILLGSSVTYSPKLQVTIPEALGIATRTNMHSNDELIYDWTINVTEEQSLAVVLRNEIASYGS